MTAFIHPEDVNYTSNSWLGQERCGNCAQFADCPVLTTLRWDGAWCDLWVGMRLAVAATAPDNPEIQQAE